MKNEDNQRFVAIMAALSQAFSMEVNREKSLIFWKALSDLPIEALEQATGEIIRLEQRFPVPAKLREYAACWRPPLQQDLNRRAIPEDTTPPEVALERLRQISATLNDRFGTSLDLATDQPVRPRLQVVK